MLSRGTVAQERPVTDSADYDLRFEFRWSAETHPEDFPPRASFSRLAGAVHDRELVQFWQEGELASPGLRSLAETGSEDLFAEEVSAAIAQGHAAARISGPDISRSPGATTRWVRVTQTYSDVTVLTRFEPSPDWFVGIAGVRLFEEGQWVEEKVVEIYALDAGTDGGGTYTSPDEPLDPPEPVSRITSGPLGNGQPIGSFRFVRRDTPTPFSGYRRGDTNSDGQVDLSDVIFTLNYLFLGGPEPSCLKTVDTFDGGGVNVSVMIYLLNFLFLGGPEPLPPFRACGQDPSGDGLSCKSYPPCAPSNGG